MQNLYRHFKHLKYSCRPFHANLIIALVLFLTCANAILYPVKSYASTCQSVVIPAYSYPNPSTFWVTAINSKPPVSILIANPNNGPGISPDSYYVSVINQAKNAGITVLGYVWTNYGAVSTPTVKSNIDKWKTFYGVNSIFLDGASSSAGDESYYKTLYDYVHLTNGTKVMLNPGVVPDQGYMQSSDIINIFEGTNTDYNGYSVPSWVKSYPANRFSNLIYNVASKAVMNSVLASSQNFNAGYLYITDQNLPNPWGALPAYWSDETAQINQNCNPAPAAPSTPVISSGSSANVSPSSTKSSSKTTPATTPANKVTTVNSSTALHKHRTSASYHPSNKPNTKAGNNFKSKPTAHKIIAQSIGVVLAICVIYAIVIRRLFHVIKAKARSEPNGPNAELF